MFTDLTKFALLHPLAVLVFILILVILWLIACFISVMPPLPQDATWCVRWAYACAQIFGASIDKAAHIAAQTTIVRNAEKFVMAADGSTIKQAVQVTQTGPVQPVSAPAPAPVPAPAPAPAPATPQV